MTLYGVSIDKKLALIMEYIDGMTLQQMIEREDVILDLPKIVDIAYQIAECLVFIH